MNLFNKKYFVKIWTDCMSAEYYETGRNEHEVYDKVRRKIDSDCYIIKVEIILDDRIVLKIQEV